ncbi:MAG: M23 family peptidase [Flavobacteriia bacterium]|nr:MAG: M23 family peptidase [Flavobacteriia bacterium]
MKKIFIVALVFLSLQSCKKNKIDEGKTDEKITEEVKPKIVKELGYILNDYKVIRDTIKSGESFGEILDRHHIPYPEIYKIAATVRDTFDIRKLRAGKPYTILAKKDSTEKAQVFIYEQNKIDYLIIDFSDSVQTKYIHKAVRTVTRTGSGVIESSLTEAMEKQKLNYMLSLDMGDIYAWTIDFFHLQKGDKFKLIYEEKFIDDSVSVGVGKIKAAYFEHKGVPLYAFNFVTDSTKNISDYYDEKAKTLRRKFLKAPLKYGSFRISSRYNLRRRIKLYGNRIRPHKGTDFAAPIGTPIHSTASGTVIASTYWGGNGNYVKIKHNATYTTQYLHMKKRAVKKGDYVKQGQVIGWIGMTGNTNGPHVCYRFWKNGKQVDPLREKLPSAAPIKKSLKEDYLNYIKPLKEQLDEIPINYPEDTAEKQ